MIRLVFDIETAPDHDIPEDLLPSEDTVKLGNVKDPEKIQAKIDAAYSKLGLHPLTGKVVAIGWKIDDNPAEVLHGDSEESLLETWKGLIEDAKSSHIPELVSFKGKSFDLPFLGLAFARHGIKFPLDYGRYIKKYDHQHRDWYNILTETFGQGKAKHWFSRFGVNVPFGEGDDVYGWYVSKEWKKIKQHCKEDVEALATLDDILLSYITL